MGWIGWVGCSLLSLALVAVALLVLGRWHWIRLTNELAIQLEAGRADVQPLRYETRELDGLPPPVQRYFRVALTEGVPMITGLTVEHWGSFNMGETTDQWRPFTSTQRVLTRRPGFVWDGRISVLPGLRVHVHDAYVAGEGILHPSIAGIATLMNLRGGGAIAQGELMRFLAEAPWYPTALLPSQGVRWEAIDDHSARASFADGAVSVSLTLHFGSDDLIDWVRADARGRTVAGRLVDTPWEGRWSNYQVRDGMIVPTSGDVAWMLPHARKSYWRGTIKSLQYEFTR